MAGARYVELVYEVERNCLGTIQLYGLVLFFGWQRLLPLRLMSH